MSAPSELQQNAQLLKFGFLADRARVSLEKARHGEALDDSDREVITQASEFLKDISDGAEIVTEGRVNCANANQSLIAFDYAVNLLRLLPNFINKNQGLSQYFASLSVTIRNLDENKNADDLYKAAEFFRILSSQLVLKHNKKRLSSSFS